MDDVFDGLDRLESFAVCLVWIRSVSLSLAWLRWPWACRCGGPQAILSKLSFLKDFNDSMCSLVQLCRLSLQKHRKCFRSNQERLQLQKQVALGVSSAFIICLHESFRCSSEVWETSSAKHGICFWRRLPTSFDVRRVKLKSRSWNGRGGFRL